MDADSSYGGSDTAQDSTFLGHDNNSLETSVSNAVHHHHHDEVDKSVNLPSNDTYYKNEVTLPINFNETEQEKSSLPHYLSTAKLTIEESLENQNNLDELSKNFNSTHNLHAESPKSKKKSGIDNPAFQEDETRHPPSNGALKSTFDENKAYTNGDLNSTPPSAGFTSPTKTDEQMAEAVNLELINLKPIGKDVVGGYDGTNGINDIPIKKETEVEIGNPYDEYFVPVNEHRKYMSRIRKGRNSVTFAETVTSTGVDDTGLSLTTPERGIVEYPEWLTALEPRGEKLYVTKDKRDKKKRNKCLCWSICLVLVAAAVIVGILAAVGVIGNQEAQPVQEARHFSNSPKLEESEVKAAGGLFGIGDTNYPHTPEPPLSTVANIMPTTDTSRIEVPRALESQVLIDNLEFSEILAHKNSTEFMNLAENLEQQLLSALFSNDVLINGPAEIELKVMEFMPGSVKVKYRIGWTFKNNAPNQKDPIDKETLNKRLIHTLSENYGYLDEYHIPESTIATEKIINMCQIDNNGCEHICSFNYRTVDFKCECPPNQHLDMDEKSCTNFPIQHTESTSSTESETLTDFEFETSHDHYPEHETPEPSHKPEHEHTIRPEPLPTVQPKPTPEPVAEPEPIAKSEPEPTAKPEPEPTAKPEPEPTAKPEPEPTVNSEPEPTSKPEPEPSAKPEPEPTSEPEPTVKPEPTANPQPEPTTKPEPTPEPVVEPEPSPEPEPAATPEPSPEPAAQPEPTRHPEPVPTVIPEPTPVTEPKTTEPAATAEPVPEPIPITELATTLKPQPDVDTQFKPEPEPSPEPETTTMHEIRFKVSPVHTDQTESVTTTKPEPEPTSPLVTYPQPNHTMESQTEAHETEHIVANSNSQFDTTTRDNNDATTRSQFILMPETTVQPEERSIEPEPTQNAMREMFTEHVMTTEHDSAMQHQLNDTLVHEIVVDITTDPSMPPPSYNATSTSTAPREPKLSDEETDVHHVASVDEVESTTSLKPEMRNSSEPMPESDNEPFIPDATTSNVKIESSSTIRWNQPDNGSDSMTVVPTESAVTESSPNTGMFVPVIIVNQTHTDSTEQTVNSVTESHSTENTIEMHSHDSTENVNSFDNMSPFLPDIENDTLINNFHSEMEHSTDKPYRMNETAMYTISENPPRLDNDEMNMTNPHDPNPTDAVLAVIPLADNDTLHSNEIVNEPATTEITNMGQPNATEAVAETTTHPQPAVSSREPTLSPDIINNVHSNNYFLKLQTSTESTEPSTELPQRDSEKIIENNVSTEDLIALETTTNKLNEISLKNATTIKAEEIQSVTETVYVIDDRPSSSTETLPTTTMMHEHEVTTVYPTSSESHQYEVHENLSEDITTLRTVLKASTTEVPPTPPPVIPLQEENDELKQERKRADDDAFNKLESVESIYDPRDLLNDINDEEKFLYISNTNTKDANEVVTKPMPDTDQEKDHYLATDFIDKSTFTSPPHNKKYIVDDKDDFYLQQIKNATMTTDTVKPVTEGFTFSHFSRCATGQFQCVNGTAIKGSSYCISNNDRCDSVDDCTDASDEVGCAQEKCLENFQCKNGQCLKRQLVCNGIADCTDGTDEVECKLWKCRFDEFSCGEGNRCVPISMKCDGRNDCPEGEDEYNCYTQRCQNNAYHCINQETCIPATWRCDGETDCMGGDDENLCECAVDQFKCAKGGGCIPKEQKCDGIEQCPDFSDEWSCLRLQEAEEDMNHNYLEVQSTNMTWLQVCSDSWNSSYSDMLCQNLGFAGSSMTDSIKVKENSTHGYFKLKHNQQPGVQLLAQLEQTNGCEFIVSISCQGFECGSQTSLDVQSARIIGGNRATETQWPSVTFLYNKKQHRQCTSTVVAPSWVLASYSCLFGADSTLRSITSEWMLHAGGTNFSTTTDNSTTQLRFVQNIIPHPQAKYSELVYSNDIVLAELATPLNLGPNVSAICLPNNEIEPRQLCVTAGWGINKPGETSRQQYLHYLPVPTIDAERCNSSEHYNGRVTQDKICAGYTESDKTPCYNDEGAPLMCFSDISNTWELHGLLSHHANCGRSHHPALYSSINKDTRQWIANTIGLQLMMNQRVALNQK